MRTPPAFFYGLAVVLLLTFAVRLAGIDEQSIWFDEGWSAWAAQQPSVVDAANADATNPPLYYALLHLFARFAGDSPFSLRLFSTLLGLFGVALAALLARRLFGQRAGVYAALLLALSPLLWWAGQEARMYTLLAALVLAAALAWHTLLRRSPLWAWGLLWGAELGLLYAHNTGPVAALWLNAVTLLAWLARRSASRPDWRLWLGGQALVALLWLPYFITRYLNLTDANSAVMNTVSLTPDLPLQLWGALWAGPWPLVGQLPLLTGLTLGALALTVALVSWRRAAARWLVAHTLILTAGVVLGLAVLGNELHGRYLVLAAPPLLVALGAGVARLRQPLRWAGAAFFAILFAVALRAADNPLYQHDDVRGMVRYYAERLTADDTVLAWSYADRYDLAYYWPRLDVAARRVTLPEGGDLDAVAPLIPAEGAVALNVWYTQRADFRGMMDCLLAHGAARPPEQFTTYGMTTLVYHDRASSLPQITPLDASFDVATMHNIGAIPPFTADRALCLPVEITLAQPVAGDLKAALIARNALGWEIARADAVFAQADQQTSAQLAPGARLAAYPLLRLPYGAPPGSYQIALRIYEEVTQPTGYEVQSSQAQVIGRDLILGVWDAPPGADWAATGREHDLPHAFNQAVGPGLTLLAASTDPGAVTPVQSGDTLPVTLLWQSDAPLPDLTLDGEGWQVTIEPTTGTARDDIVRDWRAVRVPPDVGGDATLRAGEIVIARYSVETIPGLFEPPAFDLPVEAVAPGIGALAGYRLPNDRVRLGDPLPITLVWQGGDATPQASYTVFVHLLDADGQIIAQSDALPAGGARPTTGWRPEEYILDPHTLTFNDDAHPGPATLVVGLYDAVTGARVTFAGGNDAVALPTPITVE